MCIYNYDYDDGNGPVLAFRMTSYLTSHSPRPEWDRGCEFAYRRREQDGSVVWEPTSYIDVDTVEEDLPSPCWGLPKGVKKVAAPYWDWGMPKDVKKVASIDSLWVNWQMVGGRFKGNDEHDWHGRYHTAYLLPITTGETLLITVTDAVEGKLMGDGLPDAVSVERLDGEVTMDTVFDAMLRGVIENEGKYYLHRPKNADRLEYITLGFRNGYEYYDAAGEKHTYPEYDLTTWEEPEDEEDEDEEEAEV